MVGQFGRQERKEDVEVKEETHRSRLNEDLIGETRFHDLPP